MSAGPGDGNGIVVVVGGGRGRRVAAASAAVVVVLLVGGVLISGDDPDPDRPALPGERRTIVTTPSDQRPAYRVGPAAGLEDLRVVVVTGDGGVWSGHLAGGQLAHVGALPGSGLVDRVWIVDEVLAGGSGALSLDTSTAVDLGGRVLGVTEQHTAVMHAEHAGPGVVIEERALDGGAQLGRWQIHVPATATPVGLAGRDVVIAKHPEWEVWRFSLDDGDLARVAFGQAIGADGEWLTYLGCENEACGPVVVHTASGEVTLLTDAPPGPAPALAVAPDGTRVALFSRDHDRNAVLMTIDLRTQQVVGRVEFGPREASWMRLWQLAWAPDSRGGLLVGPHGMYVFDRDATTVTAVDANLPPRTRLARPLAPAPG